jgi:N-carbamoyl-L-amino-acid hydrolase
VVLDRMETAYRAALQAIAAADKLELDEKRIWISPAVKFDTRLIQCVKAGAEKSGFTTREMASGAGHDAAYIARVAPTTMIFVPCLGGLSHNEEESTTFEECSAGAQVLLNAVLEYDRQLSM